MFEVGKTYRTDVHHYGTKTFRVDHIQRVPDGDIAVGLVTFQGDSQSYFGHEPMKSFVPYKWKEL